MNSTILADPCQQYTLYTPPTAPTSKTPLTFAKNLLSPKRRASTSATPTTIGSEFTAKGSPTKLRRGRNWVRRSMSSSDLPSTPTTSKGKGGAILRECQVLEERDEKVKQEQEQFDDKKEDNAPGLFYAYARRTDHAAFSRYILTFSSASLCNTWFSLLESEFPDAEPRRESAQLFSFKGDDVPGRAWKHKKFEGIRTKWFYTQIGDAVGTNGRPQSVLPVMDARGNVVVGGGTICEGVEGVRAVQGKNVRFEDETETRSQRDLDRLEASLTHVTHLLESTASKNAELESTAQKQSETIDRLVSALQQSAQQIKSLSEGQQRLMNACDELRRMARERDEGWNRVSDIGSGGSTASCGHDIRRPPRKMGRKVIGYVYGDKENVVADSTKGA